MCTWTFVHQVGVAECAEQCQGTLQLRQPPGGRRQCCSCREILSRGRRVSESLLPCIILPYASDHASKLICYRSPFKIGQADNVVCWFGKLDCITKTRLLKAYCSSFHGTELWDLANVNVSAGCKSWRQALRLIWKVPYNCHTAIIDALSNNLPVFTARAYCEGGLGSRNSVCPSVRPSVCHTHGL